MYKKLLFLLLLCSLILSGCGTKTSTTGSITIDNLQAEKVSFSTEDNKTIVANYIGVDSDVAAILIPQAGGTKEDYNSLLKLLNENNISVLAIDTRGQGESGSNAGNFSDKDWQKITSDIKAACAFLKEKKPNAKIGLVGASIGANAALIYAEQNSDVKAIIALSPGMDYHGLQPEESVKKLDKVAIIFAAAVEDTYSAEAVKTLAKDHPLYGKNNSLELVYAGNEHGVKLFERSPDLFNYIPYWFNAYVK